MIREYSIYKTLSKVDLPYFVKTQASVKPNAHWKVSYYGDGEKSTHENALTSINIPAMNMQLLAIDELLK